MIKKSLVLAAIFFSVAAAFAQTSGPLLVWEKSTHDFGTVQEGAVVSHTFQFTNKGKEPLILTAVQPTCGCTVPNDWPKDPILPGGTGKITVSFNSNGRAGNNTKVIRVVSNASNEGADHFTFTANVTAKKPSN